MLQYVHYTETRSFTVLAPKAQFVLKCQNQECLTLNTYPQLSFPNFAEVHVFSPLPGA